MRCAGGSAGSHDSELGRRVVVIALDLGFQILTSRNGVAELRVRESGARRGPTYAVAQTCTPRKREILMATLNPLLVAIWLTFVTLGAAEAEPPERWTCAKWLDGREQRQSTTMETWVQGYVTSSNEWALALGWTVTPLQGPQVLPLLDQSCKSAPNARLADVVFDMIRSTFWPKNRRAIKRD